MFTTISGACQIYEMTVLKTRHGVIEQDGYDTEVQLSAESSVGGDEELQHKCVLRNSAYLHGQSGRSMSRGRFAV
jgi:hypothetical protein